MRHFIVYFTASGFMEVDAQHEDEAVENGQETLDAMTTYELSEYFDGATVDYVVEE